MEDELSNALCKDCYTLVEDLIEFSDRVNRVQTLFTRLQQAGSSATVNFQEVRRECGLIADEWRHINSRNVPGEAPVNEAETDTSDYIVGEMVESLDDDGEIMAEIEAVEIVENEETAYETYVEQEESAEETYVKDEEVTKDSQAPEDPKDADLCSLTATTTNEEDIKKTPVEADDLLETQVEENEDVSNERTLYKCTSCSKGYKKPMAYRRHMTEVHGLVATDIPNLECKRCNTAFATENQLTAHYRTHMPAKDRAENSCSY